MNERTLLSGGTMRHFSESVMSSTVNSEMKIYTEDAKDGSGKKYFFEGIIAQANKPNRNKRIYPKELLFENVQRYIEERVVKNLAWGELDHPETRVNVMMKEVSHRFTDIWFDGDNVMGRAIIEDTPNGEMVKSFIRNGGQISVSTRGLGRSKPVENDLEMMEAYHMTALDIVSFPSGIDCFPNGYCENFEYVVEADGTFNRLSNSQLAEFDKIHNEDNQIRDTSISAEQLKSAVRALLKGK